MHKTTFTVTALKTHSLIGLKWKCYADVEGEKCLTKEI